MGNGTIPSSGVTTSALTGVPPAGLGTDQAKLLEEAKKAEAAKQAEAAKAQEKKEEKKSPPQLSEKELKKLTDAVQTLGVNLKDYLDDKGFLKPEKVAEAKARIASSLKKKLESEGMKKLDPKGPEHTREAIEFLRSKTEFPLLPPEQQKALLEQEPLKLQGPALYASLAGGYTRDRRIAHSIKLEGVRREEANKPDDASRLYKNAISLQPRDPELRRDAARADEAWAKQAADPKVQKVLRESAKENLEAAERLEEERNSEKYVLGFDPKDNEPAGKLYETLSREGVPNGTLNRGPDGDKDRVIKAGEVFDFVGKNLDDPRVKKALTEAGIKIPKDSEARIKEQGFARVMADHHAAQAETLNKKAGKKAKAQVAEQFHLAANFEPENPKRFEALGDFYAENDLSVAAFEMYASAKEIGKESDPKKSTPELDQKINDAYEKAKQAGLAQAAKFNQTGNTAARSQTLSGIIQLMERYAELFPDKVKGHAHPRELGDLHNELGASLAAQGKTGEANAAYKKATELYDQAIKANPHDAAFCIETYEKMAEAFHEMGDYRSATRSFRIAAQCRKLRYNFDPKGPSQKFPPLAQIKSERNPTQDKCTGVYKDPSFDPATLGNYLPSEAHLLDSAPEGENALPSFAASRLLAYQRRLEGIPKAQGEARGKLEAEGKRLAEEGEALAKRQPPDPKKLLENQAALRANRGQILESLEDEAVVLDFLGRSEEAKAVREKAEGLKDQVTLGKLEQQIAALDKAGLLDVESLNHVTNRENQDQPNAILFSYYTQFPSDPEIKGGMKFHPDYDKLSLKDKIRVLQALARSGERNLITRNLKQATGPAKLFYEGQLAVFDGDKARAKEKFQAFAEQAKDSADPNLQALLRQSQTALGLLDRDNNKRTADVLREVRTLLAPLAMTLKPSADGGVDLSTIKKGMSYEEFRKYLVDQVSIDSVAFNQVWLASYCKVLEDPKHEALFHLLYAEYNPEAQKDAPQMNPTQLGDALHAFTIDIAKVSESRFVSNLITNARGRAKLRELLKDPSLSRSFKADLLEEIVDAGERQGYVPQHLRQLFEKQLSTYWVDIDITSTEIHKATDYGLRILDIADKRDTSRGIQVDKYENNPQEVQCLKAKNLNAPITPDSVREMAQMVKSNREKPDNFSQMKARLGSMWLTAIDDENWCLGGASHIKADRVTEEERAEMANRLQDFLKEAEGIKNDAAFLAFSKRVRRYLRGQGEGKSDDYVEFQGRVARTFLGKRLGKMVEEKEEWSLELARSVLPGEDVEGSFGERNAVVAQGYSDLLKFVDEVHASESLGMEVAAFEEEVQTSDPKQKELANKLIQDLRGIQRSYSYQYKQRNLLSRGASFTASGVGRGDIADIQEAHAEINQLIAEIRQAKSPKEFEAIKQRLTEETSEGGAIYKGFAAAEMDGYEQAINLVQTIGEIVVISFVTRGAGTEAALVRSAASLRRTRNLKNAYDTFKEVRAASQLAKGAEAAEMAEMARYGSTLREMRAFNQAAAAVEEGEMVWIGARSAAAPIRSAGSRAAHALEGEVGFATKVGRGFRMGAGISLTENAVASLSGQLKTEPQDLLDWLKDSLATGMATALTVGLAPHAIETAGNNLLKGVWQRYTAQGAKGALRFLADTGLEAFEEVFDAYVRKCLDGDYAMLSWNEMRDIIIVCVGGGGTKMGALAQFVGHGVETARSQKMAEGFKARGERVVYDAKHEGYVLVDRDGSFVRKTNAEGAQAYIRFEAAKNGGKANGISVVEFDKAKKGAKAKTLVSPEDFPAGPKPVSSAPVETTREPDRAEYIRESPSETPSAKPPAEGPTEVEAVDEVLSHAARTGTADTAVEAGEEVATSAEGVAEGPPRSKGKSRDVRAKEVKEILPTEEELPQEDEPSLDLELEDSEPGLGGMGGPWTQEEIDEDNDKIPDAVWQTVTVGPPRLRPGVSPGISTAVLMTTGMMLTTAAAGAQENDAANSQAAAKAGEFLGVPPNPLMPVGGDFKGPATVIVPLPGEAPALAHLRAQVEGTRPGTLEMTAQPEKTAPIQGVIGSTDVTATALGFGAVAVAYAVIKKARKVSAEKRADAAEAKKKSAEKKVEGRKADADTGRDRDQREREQRDFWQKLRKRLVDQGKRGERQLYGRIRNDNNPIHQAINRVLEKRSANPEALVAFREGLTPERISEALGASGLLWQAAQQQGLTPENPLVATQIGHMIEEVLVGESDLEEVESLCSQLRIADKNKKAPAEVSDILGSETVAVEAGELVPQPAPGLRVIAATQDRVAEGHILEEENHVRDADRHGPTKEARAYVAGRGLEESSDFSAVTPFGRIENNIEQRLAQMQTEKKHGPLKILTLGPGQGNTEHDLKARFGDQIEIETFSLTDSIPEENRSAFSILHLGNLDTHQLPSGYDLIISIHGSFHAADQPRVLRQVLDSLNVGGEAFYTSSVLSEGLPNVAEQNYLRSHYGVIYAENNGQGALNLKPVYISKSREIPSAKEVLEKAYAIRETGDPGWYYQETKGVWKPLVFGDPQLENLIKQTLVQMAHREGFSKEEIADLETQSPRNIFNQCGSEIVGGLTVEATIKYNLPHFRENAQERIAWRKKESKSGNQPPEASTRKFWAWVRSKLKLAANEIAIFQNRRQPIGRAINGILEKPLRDFRKHANPEKRAALIDQQKKVSENLNAAQEVETELKLYLQQNRIALKNHTEASTLVERILQSILLGESKSEDLEPLYIRLRNAGGTKEALQVLEAEVERLDLAQVDGESREAAPETKAAVEEDPNEILAGLFAYICAQGLPAESFAEILPAIYDGVTQKKMSADEAAERIDEIVQRVRENEARAEAAEEPAPESGARPIVSTTEAAAPEIDDREIQNKLALVNDTLALWHLMLKLGPDKENEAEGLWRLLREAWGLLNQRILGRDKSPELLQEMQNNLQALKVALDPYYADLDRQFENAANLVQGSDADAFAALQAKYREERQGIADYTHWRVELAEFLAHSIGRGQLESSEHGRKIRANPELQEKLQTSWEDTMRALVDLGLLAEPVDLETLREFFDETIRFSTRFPDVTLDLQPDTIMRRHFLLGAKPTAESYLNSITQNLRGHAQLFGDAAGFLFSRRGRLVSELKNPKGNPTGFYLVVERGRHENGNGLQMAIFEGEPDPEKPFRYTAKVGLDFGEEGTLRIGNIQGPARPLDKSVKVAEPRSFDRLGKSFGIENPLDVLVATAIQIGRNRGFTRIEGIDDSGQLARADVVRVMGRGESFYNLFFRRFGFEPPAAGSDWWSLDLTNLPVRRKKQPSQVREAVTPEDDYFANVLNRPTEKTTPEGKRKGVRPEQWDKMDARYLSQSTLAFWLSFTPAVDNLKWERGAAARADWKAPEAHPFREKKRLDLRTHLARMRERSRRQKQKREEAIREGVAAVLKVSGELPAQDLRDRAMELRAEATVLRNARDSATAEVRLAQAEALEQRAKEQIPQLKERLAAMKARRPAETAAEPLAAARAEARAEATEEASAEERPASSRESGRPGVLLGPKGQAFPLQGGNPATVLIEGEARLEIETLEGGRQILRSLEGEVEIRREGEDGWSAVPKDGVELHYNDRLQIAGREFSWVPWLRVVEGTVEGKVESEVEGEVASAAIRFERLEKAFAEGRKIEIRTLEDGQGTRQYWWVDPDGKETECTFEEGAVAFEQWRETKALQFRDFLREPAGSDRALLDWVTAHLREASDPEFLAKLQNGDNVLSREGPRKIRVETSAEMQARVQKARMMARALAREQGMNTLDPALEKTLEQFESEFQQGATVREIGTSAGRSYEMRNAKGETREVDASVFAAYQSYARGERFSQGFWVDREVEADGTVSYWQVDREGGRRETDRAAFQAYLSEQVTRAWVDQAEKDLGFDPQEEKAARTQVMTRLGAVLQRVPESARADVTQMFFSRALQGEVSEGNINSLERAIQTVEDIGIGPEWAALGLIQRFGKTPQGAGNLELTLLSLKDILQDLPADKKRTTGRNLLAHVFRGNLGLHEADNLRISLEKLDPKNHIRILDAVASGRMRVNDVQEMASRPPLPSLSPTAQPEPDASEAAGETPPSSAARVLGSTQVLIDGVIHRTTIEVPTDESSPASVNTAPPDSEVEIIDTTGEEVRGPKRMAGMEPGAAANDNARPVPVPPPFDPARRQAERAKRAAAVQEDYVAAAAPLIADNVQGSSRKGELNRPATAQHGSFSAATDPGPYDKALADGTLVNEDSAQVLVDASGRPIGGLVLDGLGGPGGGDKASQVAGQAIVAYLQAHAHEAEAVDWTQPGAKRQVAEILGRALHAGHQAILSHPAWRGKPAHQLPGTTAVAYWIVRAPDGQDYAVVAHSGDSGAVVTGKDGKVKYRTTDQSFVQETEGHLPELERRAHPRANEVDRPLGCTVPGHEPKPTVRMIRLDQGDRIALFTDGPGDNHSTEELAEMASDPAGPDTARTRIMDSTQAKMRIEEGLSFQKRNVLLLGGRVRISLPNGQAGFLAIDKDDRGHRTILNVYDQARGGKLIDHFKPDNITAFVYEHNPIETNPAALEPAPEPARAIPGPPPFDPARREAERAKRAAQSEPLPRFSLSYEGEFAELIGEILRVGVSGDAGQQARLSQRVAALVQGTRSISPRYAEHLKNFCNELFGEALILKMSQDKAETFAASAERIVAAAEVEGQKRPPDFNPIYRRVSGLCDQYNIFLNSPLGQSFLGLVSENYSLGRRQSDPLPSFSLNAETAETKVEPPLPQFKLEEEEALEELPSEDLVPDTEEEFAEVSDRELFEASEAELGEAAKLRKEKKLPGALLWTPPPGTPAALALLAGSAALFFPKDLLAQTLAQTAQPVAEQAPTVLETLGEAVRNYGVLGGIVAGVGILLAAGIAAMRAQTQGRLEADAMGTTFQMGELAADTRETAIPPPSSAQPKSKIPGAVRSSPPPSARQPSPRLRPLPPPVEWNADPTIRERVESFPTRTVRVLSVQAKNGASNFEVIFEPMGVLPSNVPPLMQARVIGATDDTVELELSPYLHPLTGEAFHPGVLVPQSIRFNLSRSAAEKLELLNEIPQQDLGAARHTVKLGRYFAVPVQVKFGELAPTGGGQKVLRGLAAVAPAGLEDLAQSLFPGQTATQLEELMGAVQIAALHRPLHLEDIRRIHQALENLVAQAGVLPTSPQAKKLREHLENALRHPEGPATYLKKLDVDDHLKKAGIRLEFLPPEARQAVFFQVLINPNPDSLQNRLAKLQERIVVQLIQAGVPSKHPQFAALRSGLLAEALASGKPEGFLFKTQPEQILKNIERFLSTLGFDSAEPELTDLKNNLLAMSIQTGELKTPQALEPTAMELRGAVAHQVEAAGLDNSPQGRALRGEYEKRLLRAGIQFGIPFRDFHQPSAWAEAGLLHPELGGSLESAGRRVFGENWAASPQARDFLGRLLLWGLLKYPPAELASELEALNLAERAPPLADILNGALGPVKRFRAADGTIREMQPSFSPPGQAALGEMILAALWAETHPELRRAPAAEKIGKEEAFQPPKLALPRNVDTGTGSVGEAAAKAYADAQNLLAKILETKDGGEPLLDLLTASARRGSVAAIQLWTALGGMQSTAETLEKLGSDPGKLPARQQAATTLEGWNNQAVELLIDLGLIIETFERPPSRQRIGTRWAEIPLKPASAGIQGDRDALKTAARAYRELLFREEREQPEWYWEKNRQTTQNNPDARLFFSRIDQTLGEIDRLLDTLEVLETAFGAEVNTARRNELYQELQQKIEFFERAQQHLEDHRHISRRVGIAGEGRPFFSRRGDYSQAKGEGPEAVAQYLQRYESLSREKFDGIPITGAHWVQPGSYQDFEGGHSHSGRFGWIVYVDEGQYPNGTSYQKALLNQVVQEYKRQGYEIREDRSRPERPCLLLTNADKTARFFVTVEVHPKGTPKEGLHPPEINWPNSRILVSSTPKPRKLNLDLSELEYLPPPPLEFDEAARSRRSETTEGLPLWEPGAPEPQAAAGQPSPGNARLSQPAARARVAMAVVALHEKFPFLVSNSAAASAQAYVEAVNGNKTPPNDVSFLEEYQNPGRFSEADGVTRSRNIWFAGEGAPTAAVWEVVEAPRDRSQITLKNSDTGRELRMQPDPDIPHAFQEGDKIQIETVMGSSDGKPSLSWSSDAHGGQWADVGRESVETLHSVGTISRKHAQVYRRPDGSLWLRDVGSRYGTEVERNGQWVKLALEQWEQVQPNEVFRLGGFELAVGADQKLYFATELQKSNEEVLDVTDELEELDTPLPPAPAPSPAIPNADPAAQPPPGIIEIGGKPFQLIRGKKTQRIGPGMRPIRFRSANADPKNPGKILLLFATPNPTNLLLYDQHHAVILPREHVERDLGVLLTPEGRLAPGRPLPNLFLFPYAPLPLVEEAAKIAPAAAAEPQSRAELVVGKLRFNANGECILGRQPYVHGVNLTDPIVSRQHAILKQIGVDTFEIHNRIPANHPNGDAYGVYVETEPDVWEQLAPKDQADSSESLPVGTRFLLGRVDERQNTKDGIILSIKPDGQGGYDLVQESGVQPPPSSGRRARAEDGTGDASKSQSSSPEPKPATPVRPTGNSPLFLASTGEEVPVESIPNGYLVNGFLRFFEKPDGSWVMVDSREPQQLENYRQEWKQKMKILTVAESRPGKRTPALIFNNLGGAPVRFREGEIEPGREIPIRPGETIMALPYHFRFTVRKPHPAEAALAQLQPKIDRARTLQELNSILIASTASGIHSIVDDLNACLRGENTTDILPKPLRDKVLLLMGAHAKAVQGRVPKHDWYPLKEDTPFRFTPSAEQSYHQAAANLLLPRQIQGAKSLAELREVLNRSPLHLHLLFNELDRYENDGLPLNQVSKALGLQEKLKDLPPPVRNQADQNAVLALQRLDRSAQNLREWVDRLGPVQGRNKIYATAELHSILYQVLERGDSLAKVTSGQGLQERVVSYMRDVIGESKRLYREEWNRADHQNYFTGEDLGSSQKLEDLDKQYRFARMLLNSKAGRPIFGEPTSQEKQALDRFVSQSFGKQIGDYPEQQAFLRDHFRRFSPELQTALEEASAKDLTLVIEAFFGNAQHRQFNDLKTAFRLARFLGKLGYHRELGVTVDFRLNPPHFNLSLGDMNSVSPESGPVFFALHTHPKEYLNPSGRIHGMQSGDARIRTFAQDHGMKSGDSRNVLFSDTDIRVFVRGAERIAQLFANEGIDAAPLYLPSLSGGGGTFRTWVQHPFGLAEMAVSVDPRGRATGVEIRYGIYPTEGLNKNHLAVANMLREMSQDLGIPVEISQTSAERVESGIPPSLRNPSKNSGLASKGATPKDTADGIPRAPAPKQPPIFFVGKGRAPVTIHPTPEGQKPSWRVSLAKDSQNRELIKLKNLAKDINMLPDEIEVVSPGEHALQDNQGVEYIPLGGGGRALLASVIDLSVRKMRKEMEKALGRRMTDAEAIEKAHEIDMHSGISAILFNKNFSKALNSKLLGLDKTQELAFVEEVVMMLYAEGVQRAREKKASLSIEEAIGKLHKMTNEYRRRHPLTLEKFLEILETVKPAPETIDNSQRALMLGVDIWILDIFGSKSFQKAKLKALGTYKIEGLKEHDDLDNRIEKVILDHVEKEGKRPPLLKAIEIMKQVVKDFKAERMQEPLP